MSIQHCLFDIGLWLDDRLTTDQFLYSLEPTLILVVLLLGWTLDEICITFYKLNYNVIVNGYIMQDDTS